MKTKRIISIVLAVLLLIGATSALAASAGSAEDPLISLTYATGEYIDSVAKKARELINGALAALGGDKGGSASVTVAEGSVLKLRTGSSVTLVSGAAELLIMSGTVVNLSSGAEVQSGALSQYNRYLACEDTVASVTFTAASVITAEGDVEIEGVISPFTDIAPGNWFFSDVVTATSKGLINGKTATTYEPKSELTVAEAIKLAACLHQLRADGAVTLQNSASPWYQSYVDYALKNGIITGGYENYNSPITRAEFVHIFFAAYPESEYKAKNSVADGAVPDVKMDAQYADEIYAFYRAGILTGDEANKFNPSSNIVRSEVAAILTRMYDANARQSVTLP